MPLNSVKTEKPPSKKMPAAAVAFAKKMGVDMTGLEAEAQDMWKMLENMSVNDPIGYAKFVHDQLADESMAEMIGKGGAAAGKEPSNDKAQPGKKQPGSGSSSSSSSSSDSEERFLRPKAGFCVLLQTCGGDDGVKVREVETAAAGARKKKLSGKPLYVNITWHDAIQPPTDQNTGRVVAMDSNRTSADGMELPLAIGPLRDHNLPREGGGSSSSSDEEEATVPCLVVDVVVHPYVVGMCLQRSAFMRQVMELVTEWVQQERSIEVDADVPWDFVAATTEKVGGSNVSGSGGGQRGKSSGRVLGTAAARRCGYMGGRGDDENVPVMFPVNAGTCSGPNIPDGSGGKAKDKGKGGGLMSDPTSILQQMQKDRAARDDNLGEGEGSSGGADGMFNLRTSTSSSTAGKGGAAGTGADSSSGGPDIVLPFQLSASGKPDTGGPAAGIQSKVPFQQEQKGGKSAKGPLVSEVGAPTPVSAQTTKNDTKTAASATKTPSISAKPAGGPSVKKGFLNKPAAAGKLYGDEGSKEGAGGEKGGSYSSFMSRCQVVDAATGKTTMPTVLPKKAQAQAQPPPAPAPAPSATAAAAASKKPAPPVLSPTEIGDLEELAGAVDDEFAQLTAHETGAAAMQAKAFDEGGILSQLSSFGLGREPWDISRQQQLEKNEGSASLVPPSTSTSASTSTSTSANAGAGVPPGSGANAHPPAPSKSSSTAASGAAKANEVSVKCSDSSLGVQCTWKEGKLVTEISNVAPAMAAAMDLQISTGQIRVLASASASASAAATVTVSVPASAHKTLDAASAGAKYSKKHSRMTITVSCI